MRKSTRRRPFMHALRSAGDNDDDDEDAEKYGLGGSVNTNLESSRRGRAFIASNSLLYSCSSSRTSSLRRRDGEEKGNNTAAEENFGFDGGGEGGGEGGGGGGGRGERPPERGGVVHHRGNKLQVLGIRALFLLFGFSNAFAGPALAFFLVKTLRASPHIQATIAVLSGVAWNLKMPTAFLSDSVPICGYHRLSYMQIGIVAYMFAFAVLAVMSTQEHQPRIVIAAMMLFAANLGEMASAVMLETLVVEAMRHESSKAKGTLQTHSLMLMTFGGVTGTLLGGFASQEWLSIRSILFINALLKLPAIPVVCMLKEDSQSSDTIDNCGDDHDDDDTNTDEIDGGSYSGLGELNDSIMMQRFILQKEDQSKGKEIKSGDNMALTPITAVSSSSSSPSPLTAAAAAASCASRPRQKRTKGEKDKYTKVNVGDDDGGGELDRRQSVDEDDDDGGDGDNNESVGHADPPTSGNKAYRLWGALIQKRIFMPSFFIFAFSMLPDASTAMQTFYIVKLRFTPTQLALTMLVGGAAGIVGMYLYNSCFKTVDWRVFFSSVIFISCVISLSQLILVFGLNREWGIPDFVFALGDLVVIDMARTLIGMPILILVASLCPEGVKGSVYAAVTSVQIAGGTISGSLSATLIEGLSITLSNYDNLWKLVVICSCLRLLVIPLVLLLPTQLSPSPSDVDKDDDGREGVAVAGENGTRDHCATKAEMASLAVRCEDKSNNICDDKRGIALNINDTLCIDSKHRYVTNSELATVDIVSENKDQYNSRMKYVDCNQNKVVSSVPLDELHQNDEDASSRSPTTSVCGGLILIAMLVAGVGWGIGQAIYNLITV